MEKRLVLAMVLSAAVLVGWQFLFPQPDPPPPTAPADVIGSTDGNATDDRPPIDGVTTPPGAPGDDPAIAATDEPAEAALADPAERTIEVRTASHEVVFTNRGAAVREWRVLWSGESLPVFPEFVEDDLLPLATAVDDRELQRQIGGALHTVERETLEDGERIVFRWADGRGVEVTKAFVFRDHDPVVDVALDVFDRGRRKESALVLGPGFGVQDPDRKRGSFYYKGGGLWRIDGVTHHRKARKLQKNPSQVSGELQWAGVEDQYFAAILMPGGWPARARWDAIERTPVPGAAGGDAEVEAEPKTVMAVSVPDGGARLYVGPKQYHRLEALGPDLETAVKFSSYSFLYVITKYIFFGLTWIQQYVVNWGVAIIVATVLLRILLFPVNQYSMVRMKKTQIEMQRIQPKLKAIQAKYKKKKDVQSRQQMQQEQMELYKREGINPLGGITGCLPLLAQFPILIGFYNMLTVAVELRGADFALWINDLSQKDPFYIIPLLMGVTMFVQQKMAMSKVKDPQQQQQQKIMMVMPFVFTYICIQMPAGMVLYWFINNLLGIGQQWLVNKKTVGFETAAQKA